MMVVGGSGRGGGGRGEERGTPPGGGWDRYARHLILFLSRWKEQDRMRAVRRRRGRQTADCTAVQSIGSRVLMLAQLVARH
mmetsp:Transcript_924/g.2131  ORF Transcript_924/g.2131 Transcript_924/m.2131 type:complete len:81 (-) Transcript_924:265-507(-)